MKKILLFTCLVLTLISCKTKQAAVTESVAEEDKKALEIIKGHYATKKEFTTASIKASASYKDDKQAQRVSADIRIRKDEKILVSIRFLGITMAKALITPTEVKYYEKINGQFFEGDYAKLSKWLGTDLDFSKVQNMLLGMAMDDLTKGKYKASIEDQLYKLEALNTADIQKTFYFEAGNFLTKKQELGQPAKNRSLEVTYPEYHQYGTVTLPARIKIEALDGKKKTSIAIDYENASFNEDMTFPYSVPDGYERVNIE